MSHFPRPYYTLLSQPRERLQCLFKRRRRRNEHRTIPPSPSGGFAGRAAHALIYSLSCSLQHTRSLTNSHMTLATLGPIAKLIAGLTSISHPQALFTRPTQRLHAGSPLSCGMVIQFKLCQCDATGPFPSPSMLVPRRSLFVHVLVHDVMLCNVMAQHSNTDDSLYPWRFCRKSSLSSDSI